MTAKTMPEALAIEAARGAEYRAEIRAEGFRAGAEAMRETAAAASEATLNTAQGGDFARAAANRAARKIADRIRSLSIPEDNANGR